MVTVSVLLEEAEFEAFDTGTCSDVVIVSVTVTAVGVALGAAVCVAVLTFSTGRLRVTGKT